MSERIRLTGEARRTEIINAARQVFADKGFHGTTTRELAKAANVSEALLFKHFPSKEALYSAMLEHVQSSEIGLEYSRLLTLTPGTSSLITLLHFIAAKVISPDAECRTFHALILRSLGEDGVFAKVLFKNAEDELIPVIHRCLLAAQKAGDMRLSVERLKSGEWLTHHVLVMLAFMHLSHSPRVGYRANAARLPEEAVIFCLRGLGLKDEVIERQYNPRALELLTRA